MLLAPMADRCDVALFTFTCKKCGSTWTVVERYPDGEDRFVKTATYRCPECGHGAVMEVKAAKLKPSGRPPRGV
jgi:DNA-directed RNA polymerase subunit RPC12/RpoP